MSPDRRASDEYGCHADKHDSSDEWQQKCECAAAHHLLKDPGIRRTD